MTEDIACRAWQKAYDKQHQFNSKQGTPEQWIFTIARNEVNKHFRFWQLKRFFSLTEQEENKGILKPNVMQKLMLLQPR